MLFAHVLKTVASGCMQVLLDGKIVGFFERSNPRKLPLPSISTASGEVRRSSCQAFGQLKTLCAFFTAASLIKMLNSYEWLSMASISLGKEEEGELDGSVQEGRFLMFIMCQSLPG